MSAPIEGVVICGEQEAMCICVLPPHGPEVPHRCNPEVCTGSWTYVDGEFSPIAWPTPVSS